MSFWEMVEPGPVYPMSWLFLASSLVLVLVMWVWLELKRWHARRKVRREGQMKQKESSSGATRRKYEKMMNEVFDPIRAYRYTLENTQVIVTHDIRAGIAAIDPTKRYVFLFVDDTHGPRKRLLEGLE